MNPIERQISILANKEDRKYVKHNEEMDANQLQNQLDKLRKMLEESEKSANDAIEQQNREDTVSRLNMAIELLGTKIQQQSDGHDDTSLNDIELELAALQNEIENVDIDDERKAILRNRLSTLMEYLNGYRSKAAHLSDWLRRMKEKVDRNQRKDANRNGC